MDRERALIRAIAELEQTIDRIEETGIKAYPKRKESARYLLREAYKTRQARRELQAMLVETYE